MSRVYKYLYSVPGYLPDRIEFYSKHFSGEKLALEAIKDYFRRFHSFADSFPEKIVLYSRDGKQLSKFKTQYVPIPNFIVEKID